MTAVTFPLAEALTALRTQLGEAALEAADERLKFDVTSIEVEFQVVAEREASGGGKIGFRIFGLGSEASAGGKLTDGRTQTIKISLTPKMNGQNIQVSDEDDRPSAYGSRD